MVNPSDRQGERPEHQRAEESLEALRTAEEQFRRAVKDAPIPMILQAEDGQVLLVSRSWTELTGYTLADLPTFDAWLNHAYGYGADAVRTHMHLLFAGERQTLDVAFAIHTRTGEVRHWSFSASSPGRLRDGRRFVVGMALDITKQTRNAMVLAEQARLLDLSNDAIIVRDVNNRIVYWNHGATELYGWTRDEAIGQDLHTLLRTEFEIPFEQLLSQLHQQDRLEREVVQMTRDGRRLTLLCRWALDRDQEGRPGAILTTYNDITERKRMEQALRASEERQAFLLKLSDALQTLADPIEVQATASRLLGEHLGADRAYYVEIDEVNQGFVVARDWHRPGAPSHAGRSPLDDWPMPWLRKGDTWVVCDTDSDPAMPDDQRASYRGNDIGAAVVVPLVKRGRLVATLAINQRAPRAWTPSEVLLVEEVAERTWAAVERAQAQAAVRKSEARFRTLADVVPQVIWTNDAEGNANYFNERWYTYSGLSFAESEGLGWQRIVHPEDAPVSVERWQRALAAGEVFNTEYRLRRADGVYHWQLGRNVPLRDEDGRITGWFGSATDIEDLKQAEQAVRESEERFRLLVEGAHDYAMFLLDPDNRITFWSVGAERLFGYTEAEAIGQSSAIIFTSEDRERGVVEHEVRTALTEGRVEDRRWHVRKDGSRLFLDGVQLRLDDETGGLRGFVKIGRDATTQYQAEEALQRARAELETRVQERTSELATANQLLQQEIAERRRLAAQRAALMERIISAQEAERQRIARELHDTLGQFLSALNLRLSMAQSLDGLPPSVHGELAQLRALTGRIDQEVDRLTMELRPPALEHLGLPDALHSYAEEWIATSGIPVDVVVTGLDTTRLPAVIEATTYRIVQEALTNVLKHAQARSVSVIIERRGGELRVIVEDDGVGFEPRQSTAQGNGGRQVGLIGMAERAALAGGELLIESAPGTGASIYLRIPLGDDPSGGTGGAREYDPGVTG
ncbi:MAG TPA: PAS domain S-box protein [Roseiflexaceae bacterium]|nr:PAS domain S-box protein [Roseiflexaceae bacterium]